MIDFIVIRVTDDEADDVDQGSPYAQLLRIYDGLDHDGKVAMLACAYSQKLRMKTSQKGQA